ncbi:MAG: hypothetical protein H8D23_22180 [Candidatus Brocadiales bacterium]|nr:hypothetical protein [Candidatus Brocadiales bacterium]
MSEENDNLMELYKLFRAETHKSIEMHAQHFSKFLTLITAILGSTLAGIHYFKDPPYFEAIIAILGGILSALISFIGIKMCDQFYKGMLEAITVTAKIEALLGIENIPGPELNLKPLSAFKEDPYLLPMRWIKERATYATSNEFINASLCKGSNKYVKYTLVALIVLSLSFIVFGVFKIGFVLLEYCK